MNVTVLGIKQRFGIIGISRKLDQAIDIAIQVAATDLSVLVTGESGSGKESFPKIIHALSSRKHKDYIAVNCGAIPEGTIDSELFGHEKGAFTGATDTRKGYFEVADGGTIFLDEVGELPLSTQARLLRVLESGEFIKVGSSKVQKTNVRIVAATNVNIPLAIQKGKFREDLYYRLNTIPISVPSLKERKEDIHLLFKKFAIDMAEKYHMPPLRLEPEAVDRLVSFRWPGNIRQLKNVAEQMSILEAERKITLDLIEKYIPNDIGANLPVISRFTDEANYADKVDAEEFRKEREILYKILFEMRRDVNELKKLVVGLLNDGEENVSAEQKAAISRLYSNQGTNKEIILSPSVHFREDPQADHFEPTFEQSEEVVEENYSLADKEKEFIIKALEKYRGKRKHAAKELGISERTLYRKINEYNIDL